MNLPFDVDYIDKAGTKEEVGKGGEEIGKSGEDVGAGAKTLLLFIQSVGSTSERFSEWSISIPRDRRSMNIQGIPRGTLNNLRDGR
ncbi:hypothetical protein E2C01_055508 [Portunus trituberculatus]|uniref:Uncharacterized protein n=1 Tax=Portunus trituberculatus TaxID=210409 RepID=A0A5B7GUZ6_PORTR|nr:hypothetical protein [Portunus trituberculatus]